MLGFTVHEMCLLYYNNLHLLLSVNGDLMQIYIFQHTDVVPGNERNCSRIYVMLNIDECLYHSTVSAHREQQLYMEY